MGRPARIGQLNLQQMTQRSPNWEKSRLLFETYSQNFNAVKRHPKLHVQPDVDSVFTCPLCFQFFTQDEVLVEDASSAPVTEHVPPKALGGKQTTLTLVFDQMSTYQGSTSRQTVRKHGTVSRGSRPTTYLVYTIDSVFPETRYSYRWRAGCTPSIHAR